MRNVRYLLLIAGTVVICYALIPLIGILAYGVMAGAITLWVGLWVAG